MRINNFMISKTRSFVSCQSFICECEHTPVKIVITIGICNNITIINVPSNYILMCGNQVSVIIEGIRYFQGRNNYDSNFNHTIRIPQVLDRTEKRFIGGLEARLANISRKHKETKTRSCLNNFVE